MTIDSRKLIIAVKSKDIANVKSQLEIALSESIVLINNPGALEKFKLQPRIHVAQNALNTTMAKGTCTVATKVASYLVDPTIVLVEKKLWVNILLDMLIIGCDYRQENPADKKSILSYIFECNDIPELNQIREIYKPYAKFDLRKLVELKELSVPSVSAPSTYVSLHGLSMNGAGASKDMQLNKSTEGASTENGIATSSTLGGSTHSNTLFRAVSPVETDCLLKTDKSKNSTDSKNIKVNNTDEEQDDGCYCWPFRY